MKNPYQPIESTIENIKTESGTIKTFTVKMKTPFAFKTGQFVEVTIPGEGEAPFTPSSDPQKALKEPMDITIMKAGRITGRLHEMEPGATIGVRGPYGKGYPVEKFEGKEIVIVGGGVGLAPLRTLLYTVLNSIDKYKKVYLRYGARTPDDIIFKKEVDQWGKRKDINMVVTVDNGNSKWKGHVGLVTTILDDIKVNFKEAPAIVCGPPIMMKFATFKLIELGFLPENIYLSMEKNMSCGIGKCGHCRLGKYYACKEGPVFTFEQLKDNPDIWD
ncbi:FAD/NAD(P)-binding protein [Candidatus Omnitrophota bacterium]